MAEVVDELDALGASAGQVAVEADGAARAEAADRLELWPENWDAFRLFLRCATQWRSAPHGGRMGLDYPAVEWVARRIGVEVDEAAFDRLQVMELEALAVWAEERERAQQRAERERNR